MYGSGPAEKDMNSADLRRKYDVLVAILSENVTPNFNKSTAMASPRTPTFSMNPRQRPWPPRKRILELRFQRLLQFLSQKSHPESTFP